LYYIKKSIGGDWGNSEIKKPREERHPILQWYDQVCLSQQETIKIPGVVASGPMTGAIEAYIQLAYNLYLLSHNEELQSRLIKRLKNLEAFPGAYYETYVYAALIKAGFDIEFEDESDGRSTHCECVAICRMTGNRYSVEAKSIRRNGALGAKENTTKKSLQGSIRDQMYDSLCKESHYPRIIFIDVNLPNPEKEKTPRWINEAVQSIKVAEEKITINQNPAPSAYVFFTNHPHHYQLAETDYGRSCVGVGFKIPDFGHGKVYKNLREMYYAKVKHSDIHHLMNSIKVHYDIPSTFDAEIPEFYFGDSSTPRLKIGHSYIVPDGQGGEVVGELTTATVSEQEKQVIGAFHIRENNRSIIAKCPISDEELLAYKKYPDTFFGVIRSQGRKIDDPFEMFEWMLESYKKTSKQKLLEFMKDHQDADALCVFSQEELAVLYCERCMYGLLAQQKNSSVA